MQLTVIGMWGIHKFTLAPGLNTFVLLTVRRCRDLLPILILLS